MRPVTTLDSRHALPRKLEWFQEFFADLPGWLAGWPSPVMQMPWTILARHSDVHSHFAVQYCTILVGTIATEHGHATDTAADPRAIE